MINTVLRMVDRFTAPMRGAIRASYEMQKQTEKVEEVTRRYQKTSMTSANSVRAQISSLAKEYVKLGMSAQEAMNKAQAALSKTGKKSSGGGIATGIIAANQGLQLAQEGMQSIKAVTDIVDNYSNTKARLDLMNDGLQTTAQLQDMVYQAAQRSRGSYDAMGASVAKMGLLAKNAFKNNKEIVNFTELVQKSFKIGGASTQEQQAGMYQLTQAMASGKLQGDEFRSIMENAPMIADAISKYTGISKGKLKEMSAEGTISADIIKNAMFKMSDDINKRFDSMPMTFGDAITKMTNIMKKHFGPVMERIIQIFNSPKLTKAFSIMEGAIKIAARVMMILLNVATVVGNFIISKWSIIEPILWGIGGALIALVIPSIWGMITALWAVISPIIGIAAAWLIAHWQIALIGAAIALLIWWILKAGETFTAVVGYIGGIFGILFTFLYNKFAFIANYFLSVAEFFANVFKDPVYAVKKLFYDMSIDVLSYIANLAKGIEDLINKIPGVSINITSGMESLLGTLKANRDALKSTEDVVKLMRFEQMDYGNGFDMGQDIGKKIGGKIVNTAKGMSEKLGNIFNSDKIDAATGKNTIDKIGTVDTVGKIKDDVNIAEEDIKLMRELAEQKAIQNFVTLTPKINTKIGAINENADADRLLGQLTEKLINEVSNSAKGVYA